MRLLMFLILSRYGLACKYGIVFQISICYWQKQPPEVFYEKSFLRNFPKFTGKYQCQSLFFNKVAGAACNFIKKETLAQVFSREFCEISQSTFFTEHLWTTACELGAELHLLTSSITIANHTRLKQKLDSIYFLNGRCFYLVFF